MKNLAIFILMSLFFNSSQATPQKWMILTAGTTITAASFLSVWFGTQQPSTCDWCETINDTSFDIQLSKETQWSNRAGANLAGDIMAYGIFPALSLTSSYVHSETWEECAENNLQSGNAILINFFTTTLIKRLTARERPEIFFNYSNPGNEEFQSFPSGHTSFAFCLATTASALAFRKQTPWAYLVLLVTTTLAGITGYFRVAAARHWPTDVMAGTSIGVLMGLVVPSILIALQK